MSWLLLLIFWKPVYLGVRWAISKDDTYKEAVKTWFSILLGLVKP